MGFAFVVIALGASLLYKGYKGWSWAQFYSGVLGQGTTSTATAAPKSNTTNAAPAAKPKAA